MGGEEKSLPLFTSFTDSQDLLPLPLLPLFFFLFLFFFFPGAVLKTPITHVRSDGAAET